jgi:beta-lactamase superfamily II metal-dependent hydrolase
MKLTVFQSDNGDCNLVIGKDGKTVFADGGMRASFSKHAAPALSKLAAIDLAYVSHIDQDHISGMLQLFDDVVAWRVHDFQLNPGNTHHPEPTGPRPPEIKQIWHNAFHEQLGKNAGPIEDMLAANATILSGSEAKSIKELASAQAQLAASVGEAIQLSRRVGAAQLNIPLNAQFEGKLMFFREAQPEIKIGGMKISVIGPFDEDLGRLRKDWNKWLKDNETQLKAIQAKAKIDEENLGSNAVGRIIEPLLAQAKELGNRAKVTPPNLASLMLFVEEGDKSMILSGDGHATDILKGLEHHGKFDGNGKLHVNIMKVAHHGSEHNTNAEICRRITADHYVFCGNGEHDNPDLDVIELIATSRFDGDSKKFKFWFNSSEEATAKDSNKPFMKKVETLASKLATKSGGRLKNRFLKTASFNVNV